MTIAAETTRARTALSFEALLYLAIVTLTLAVRLPGLDAHPLNDAEAREALTAWRFSQGLSSPTLPASPAYLSFTALGFMVLGDADFVGRLAPALFGAALVLLPWLLRDALGRGRALLTSVLLAGSSIVWMASRSADGTVVAAFFVLLTAIAVWRSVRADGELTWAVVAGAAFGASLAAGPQALIGLIALAVALPLTAGAWDALMAFVRSRARELGLAALVGFLAVGTLLLLNRDGLGAAAASWVTFAQRFVPSEGARTLTALLALLGLYDPLIVLAGLIAFASAFARGGLDRFSASAAIVALTIVVASGGRSQFDLVWLIVFLAPLAAHTLLRLFTEFDWRHSWALPVSVALILIAVLAYVWLGLAQFATVVRGSPTILEGTVDFRAPPWNGLVFPALGLVALPLIVGLIGLGWSFRSALMGVALAAVFLATSATLTAGWGQTQLRSGSPVELWWPRPVGADLARLRETLFWAGEQTISSGTEIEVTVQASPDSALAWALRGFPKARFVDTLGTEIATAAVIAPAALETDVQPDLGAAYVGAPFQLNPIWFPDTLFWYEQLDWLLYRRAAVQNPTITILWLRQDVQMPPAVQR